ncbi:MAG: hypothetical protein CM1200mP40_03900 [Gammaproteobacteria bacterium]|nr:MAG: hypothetical protein CM1200mP40_03900 [Gammaproteobacteria bacterium]
MAVLLDSIIGGIQWLTENRNRQVPAKKYKQVKFAVIAMLGGWYGIFCIQFAATD